MTDQELKNTGFTVSGITRYQKTVADYAATLLKKSVSYATGDKAEDASLEVTHDHVRSAAHKIASSFSREPPSGWIIPLQLFESLALLGAGVGGGNLSQKWGYPLLFLGLALAVISFSIRTMLQNFNR